MSPKGKSNLRASLSSFLESHQASELDWVGHEPAKVAGHWSRVLKEDFKIECEPPIVGVAKLRRDQPIAFRAAHNELGIAGVLRVDTGFVRDCLDARAEWAITAHILYGLLVAEQHAIGHLVPKITEPGPELQKRAAELGLRLRGVAGLLELVGPPSPLFDLIERHGGKIPSPGGFILPERRQAKSTLKLWTCACGNKVRVGKKSMGLVCAACWELFRPSEKSEGVWLHADLIEVEEVLELVREWKKGQGFESCE